MASGGSPPGHDQRERVPVSTRPGVNFEIQPCGRIEVPVPS